MRKSGADIVILQDGSASMYVKDVKPDRWRRSVQFLRVFADALSWKGDRVALALFAHTVAPQVRLTKDPNSFFFFLDHLGEHSPFRLEDNPTWDTNIEKGIDWGVQLVEKDQELFGKVKNPKGFVVITDGQAWSGDVAIALLTARQKRIPVNVVGVGTIGGGMIPEAPRADGTIPPPTIHAGLDRESLRQIAGAGGRRVLRAGPRAGSRRGVPDHRKREAAGGDEPRSTGRGEPRGALLAVPLRGRPRVVRGHVRPERAGRSSGGRPPARSPPS